MDAVIKVTFPAYARMQEHKKELSQAIEKTLFFISLLVFPMVIGLCLLAQPLVMILPRYSKWEIALLALYLYAINSFWGAVTTPLTNALTAIGKIKTVFKLMIMWTVLTWIFFPLLAIKFGFNGVAAASAIVATSSVVAIWITKQHIEFKFLASISKPIVASLMMGILIFILTPWLAKNVFGIIGMIALGGLVYFGLIYLMMGQEFITNARRLFYALKTR